MNNDIIRFCKNIEPIYGVLDIFKNEFLSEFSQYKSKERLPILKAIPYLYRLWFYSILMSDIPLSPSNFINAQINEKYGDDFRVVPIAVPVYKNRLLKDFEFEFKVFNVDNHPVLDDLKLFIEHCIPDVAVDENGLLLEKDRDGLIASFNFKEIFYATFLTDLAYSLNLIKKMPSINTYRSMANRNSIEKFFNLSKPEQLKKIVDAVIGTASKSLSSLFDFDTGSFSKESLTKLFSNSQSLDEYSRNLFKKHNIDIRDLDLEELYLSAMENGQNLDIREDTLMALSLNVDFNFLMDSQLLTPLGHYLQLIQPIYNQEMIFQFHFAQLIEACKSNIPPIKLYFLMCNSFDITPLGKEILLDGKPPKNIFQELTEDYSFDDMYHDLANYYNTNEFLDMDFGDFNMPDDELDRLISEFKDMLTPFKKKSRRTSLPKNSNKEALINPNLVYCFKIKHYNNKRSWQAIELKGTQTLDNLASTIVNTFNLGHGHLYSFFMSNKAWDRESEITSPYNSEEKDLATKHKIYKLQLHEKQKFLFLYNFADEVRFEIELAGTAPVDKAIKYPRIAKTSRDYIK